MRGSLYYTEELEVYGHWRVSKNVFMEMNLQEDSFSKYSLEGEYKQRDS